MSESELVPQRPDIFLAYDHADEVRAHRLAEALRGEGFTVWTHTDLQSGANWHDQIEATLSAAHSVVVLWSRDSTGAGGEFVRDEARMAKDRGVLIPVLLHRVDPPLGFRELQTVDLSRWRSSTSNPRFRELCATVEAHRTGKPVPTFRRHASRLRRSLTYGALAGAGGAVMAFAFNLFAAQNQVCAAPLPFLQPTVSDLCGAVGFGDRPTRAERQAWARLEPGSCPALRSHVATYPDGAYRQRAADLLSARALEVQEDWVPAERRLALFTERGASFRDEGAAREDALARAQPHAERLCRTFGASTLFRVVESSPSPQAWTCDAENGVACGFSGEAVCSLEERTEREIESCPFDGSAPTP